MFSARGSNDNTFTFWHSRSLREHRGVTQTHATFPCRLTFVKWTLNPLPDRMEVLAGLSLLHCGLFFHGVTYCPILPSLHCRHFATPSFLSSMRWTFCVRPSAHCKLFSTPSPRSPSLGLCRLKHTNWVDSKYVFADKSFSSTRSSASRSIDWSTALRVN